MVQNTCMSHWRLSGAGFRILACHLGVCQGQGSEYLHATLECVWDRVQNTCIPPWSVWGRVQNTCMPPWSMSGTWFRILACHLGVCQGQGSEYLHATPESIWGIVQNSCMPHWRVFGVQKSCIPPQRVSEAAFRIHATLESVLCLGQPGTQQPVRF